VIDPTVADTANAYIYKQNPERFNEDGIKQKIRPGQLMDVWLSAEKPMMDTTNAPVQLEF
jgi:eukaryotic-like serine/threonine-protein kinase